MLTTRREFIAGMAGGMPAVLVPAVLVPAVLVPAVLVPAVLVPARLQAADAVAATETATIAAGDLNVSLRDNSRSPQILSGVTSLVHRRDAPDFSAFDRDSQGAAAGLNFEHIISGHKNNNNKFTPRIGPYRLSLLPDGKGARLVRTREDDQWSVSSTLTYTVTSPHYIDVEFHCVPHDRAVFGERGYAIFFFANYMNDVQNVALNFRGIAGPGMDETWIAADAPAGHPHWNKGGTYRSARASDVAYDADHNFTLNSWSYDYPRFTLPFYYGRAANGMMFQLMFDRAWTEQDEVRFSIFKFKLPRLMRPAWDFQYVVRNIEADKEYGFRMRLAWKKFISSEDCLKEYQTWSTSGD